ncbi:hypothetical protein D6D01_06583 [Aureobasidium pullulans]|uniref:Uncharacterized protein n=1 Tax=Aureobasidium pullulans TaxID=5580 RepID=A0A4S9KZA8_AURPU|nr:hypothetical protein D6D01_06583 [Aureobasidium pullulans]
MATKQDLVKQKYILLSVIHLNGFQMSPEMADRLFHNWPPIMGDRPTSAQEVLKMYDEILDQPVIRSAPKTPKISRSVKTTPESTIDSPFNLARPRKSAQSTHMASHDLDSCQQPDPLSHAAREPDIVPFSPVHPESQPIRKPNYVPFENGYDIEQSDDDEKNQQRSQSSEETLSKHPNAIDSSQTSDLPDNGSDGLEGKNDEMMNSSISGVTPSKKRKREQ